MRGVGEIQLKEFGDKRGSLISLEGDKNIPFGIKRVYYIFNTSKNVKRGCHAHKSLKQVLVCTSGECKVSVSDGVRTEEYYLNKSNMGLYIGPMLWRELYHFSNDCVLMVLASDYYTEDDYIRDYHEYHRLIEKNKEQKIETVNGTS
jgi:dTDP-4-dehydrorhamnose 3,5-epimerase-like enzyme